MLTDLVRPGDKIELQAVERAIMGDKTDRRYLTSKIYDVIDDEKLEILMPMDGTKLILLPVDGEFQFCFYTKNGLYQCFVRIADRYKENNIYLLLCEVTSPIGKYQRRSYYRYACTMPLKTRDLMEEEAESLQDREHGPRLMMGLPMTKGKIADISGGGVRFISSVQYPEGAKILINFSLNYNREVKEYQLVGRVLHSWENANRSGEFEHRVKFILINRVDREEIIKYIFEEERKNRKRMADMGN
ncbi:MAG: flagellar brake protein [Lachnospiraceae bacterium]|nr:flagellar brake protein [Lachnospiraceae bacterium]